MSVSLNGFNTAGEGHLRLDGAVKTEKCWEVTMEAL